MIELLSLIVQILALAIFFRAILSWFPMDPRNPLVVLLNQITEPILAPLRQVVPRIGMIDITPMVAIIILMFIGQALRSA